MRNGKVQKRMIVKTVKKALKKALPKALLTILVKLRQGFLGLEREYRGLSTEQVFDKIYREGAWGRDKKGNAISGAGSHTDNIIDPYVSTVKKVLSKLNSPIIVDLGCGDFNVGKNFTLDASHYIACDVSNFMIKKNREIYSSENVEFRQLNIAEDELPRGHIAFVRQVLQHLGNDDIKRFVETVNKTAPHQYLLVTEHIATSPRFRANIDKPKGPGIRVSLRSGVDIAEEPFNLNYKEKEVLLEVDTAMGDLSATIRSTLYTI
ncbi:MAG: methyltransferase domain-containing protein [Alphaproteobacteria bacterium]|nr:methyltransferase domain-containing protein [Alphaproteobacteria bacterium]